MKTLKKCSVMIAMLCTVVFIAGCSPEPVEINVVNYISNNADFVVKNKTTGENVKNLESGLEIKNGDVLELVYECPEKYQEYSWKVKFELFDTEEITVSQFPYSYTYTVKNISAGSYNISCSASINEENVTGTSLDFGIVGVDVQE